MVVGGLHLLQDSPQQVEATLDMLAQQYRVKTVALGRCLGELTFLRVQQRWGKESVYAGLWQSFAF